MNADGIDIVEINRLIIEIKERSDRSKSLENGKKKKKTSPREVDRSAFVSRESTSFLVRRGKEKTAQGAGRFTLLLTGS